MRQKSVHPESPSERIVKNIRRATRKRHSSEEKIRIVLDGLRGDWHGGRQPAFSGDTNSCLRAKICQCFSSSKKSALVIGSVAALAIW